MISKYKAISRYKLIRRDKLYSFSLGCDDDDEEEDSGVNILLHRDQGRYFQSSVCIFQKSEGGFIGEQRGCIRQIMI